MLSSQLSARLNHLITPDKYSSIENYINSLSYRDVISIENAASKLSLGYDLTDKLLHALAEEEILQSKLSIICPECRHSIKDIDDVNDIDAIIRCRRCEDDVEIDSSDVEERFSLIRNSNAIAREWPDNYSLLEITKECGLGINQGRVLHVGDSIEELSTFAKNNNYSDKLLEFVIGDNLL